jgi:hypothetical protein
MCVQPPTFGVPWAGAADQLLLWHRDLHVLEGPDCTRDELEANRERARQDQSLELLSRSLSMIRMEQLHDVVAVEVIGDRRLRLTFDDGTVGEVDFSDRALGGVLEPLRDPAYFARVHVDPEAGTIAWPNGVDFAPEPLYDEARLNLIQSASTTD